MFNDVLRDLLNKSLFVYLDDILIFFFFQVSGGTCWTRAGSVNEVIGKQIVRKSGEM